MNKRRTNGMGTLINKGEGKPFLAKWVFEGKTYYRSTGEVNKNKALKVLEKFTRPFREDNKLAVLKNLENEVKDQEDKIESEKMNLPGILLSEIDNRFRNSLLAKDITASTLDQYTSKMNTFIKWVNNNHKNVKEMKDVSKKIAEEYMCFVADTKSSDTFNCVLALFKKIWEMFKEDGHYNINVFEDISRRKGEISRRRELNSEEIIKIFDYIKNDEDKLCLFAIGIYTGLRIGDCAKLKWCDVDLFKKNISVIPEKTKRHTGRIVIPMHQSLFTVLSKRWMNKGDDEYVMPKMAKMYKTRYLTSVIKQIFVKCGIKHSEIVDGKMKYIVGFHSLRHTFVSMNINGGMNPLLVQKIVGHKAIDMTNHYFHSNENVIRSGIEKMPDLVGCEGYVDMSVKDADVDLLKSVYDEKRDKNLSDTVSRLVRWYKEYSKMFDIKDDEGVIEVVS